VRLDFWTSLIIFKWIFYCLKDSYYSTSWSNSVRTLVKPPGNFSLRMK
jgi:hypothetical protein